MIRSHQNIELHNENKRYKGKKLLLKTKKAYLNIMKLIIANDISDSEAVEIYNQANNFPVKYGTFNSFKTKHRDQYWIIIGGIKSNFDDEPLLLFFP